MCSRNMTVVGVEDIAPFRHTFEYIVESDIYFQGPSSVEISSLEDLAGNLGEDVTLATGVAIDVVEPVVETLLVSSSGADWRFASTGDVITVTLSSSEAIFVPTVALRHFEWEGCSTGCDWVLDLIGGSGGVAGDLVGTSFSFSYLVDDSSFEGRVEAVVAAVIDRAYNSMDEFEVISDSTVTIDSTPPTVSSVMVQSSNVLDESLATVGDVITVTIDMMEYSSMPLVELFYYADGDCEYGCAVAVDEVHRVVDAEHAEACEVLGLVACAGPSGVRV